MPSTLSESTESTSVLNEKTDAMSLSRMFMMSHFISHCVPLSWGEGEWKKYFCIFLTMQC